MKPETEAKGERQTAERLTQEVAEWKKRARRRGNRALSTVTGDRPVNPTNKRDDLLDKRGTPEWRSPKIP
jgi:hypothetical protein